MFASSGFLRRLPTPWRKSWRPGSSSTTSISPSRADPEAPKWQVFDRHDSFGDLDTEFKDVVLKFNPAGGLKFLAEHALKLKPKYHYSDVEPPPAWRPYELGYAPTALAVSSPEKGWAIETEEEGDKRVTKYAWPGVIRNSSTTGQPAQDAREYATDDIVYTRALDKHFGCPEPGDNDSTLTCMVAAVRWHGFTINRRGIEALKAKAQAAVATSPVNINKPSEVRAYVTAAMDGTEKVILETPRRRPTSKRSAGGASARCARRAKAKAIWTKSKTSARSATACATSASRSRAAGARAMIRSAPAAAARDC